MWPSGLVPDVCGDREVMELVPTRVRFQLGTIRSFPMIVWVLSCSLQRLAGTSFSSQGSRYSVVFLLQPADGMWNNNRVSLTPNQLVSHRTEEAT